MPMVRSGLPAPRVQDPSLQRFLEGVAEQLRGFDALVGRILDRRGYPGAFLGPGDVGDTGEGVPTLGVPPSPAGFFVRAGVNLVVAFWDNPFAHYANHGLTRIYRHTADEFNNATAIGMSSDISYVDAQVVAGDYWYWIRWESTTSVLGPVSDSIRVTVSEDPEVAIMILSDDILNDPLTIDLLTPVDENETLQRIQERVAGLLDYVANTIRARALEIEAQARAAALMLEAEARAVALALETQARENALVLEAEARAAALALERQAREAALMIINDEVARVNAELVALEARITGTNLGPVQNGFMGTTRADAEAARDAYAVANPTWLADYDADDDLNIRLTYGVLRQYQNRVSGAWANNGEEEPTAAAVSMLQADTQTNAAGITQNATQITLLTVAVGGKADLSALQALTSRVSANEGTVVTNQMAITALMTDVAGRATLSAVQALTNRVVATENAITVSQTEIVNLMAQLPGFATLSALSALTQTVSMQDGRITANADAITLLMTELGTRASVLALDALSTRVSDTEDALTVQASRLTVLEASTGGSLGPEQNEFAAASKDAVLVALDAYAVANPAWFAQYRNNPENAVELSWN